MKQTHRQRKKFTALLGVPEPISWRLQTHKPSFGKTYLNGLKKVMSFVTLLVVMAFWLASTASLAVAGDKTDIDVFKLNTDRTLYGKTDGWQFDSNPVPGYNIVRTFRNSAGE